jgi:hypothetical protein
MDIPMDKEFMAIMDREMNVRSNSPTNLRTDSNHDEIQENESKKLRII